MAFTVDGPLPASCMKIHRLANDFTFSDGRLHSAHLYRRSFTIIMAPLPPPPPPPVTLPSSHPVPSAKTTDTLLTKSQKFIEEHKLLVLGAAVLAVSGAGYYLYSSSSAANKPRARIEKDSSSDEEETGAAAGVAGKSEKKKKKKSSKSKSKKKSAADSSLDRLSKSEESPLLEERDAEEVKRILERKRAKEQEAGVKTQGTQGGELNVDNVTDKSTPATTAASASTSAEAPVPSYLEGIPRTKEEIAKLPSSERKTLATTLKTRGNKLYGAKKYKEAVACYTKALEVAEKEEAVFYSNRAACYQNMTPPNYDQVVKDCDSALRLDSGYVKALNRRATAYEALGRDEEALRDFTATTIMEKFQNDAASTSVERVLKKIASKKAEEMLSTREPRLPSKTFVSAYLGAFRPRTCGTICDTTSCSYYRSYRSEARVPDSARGLDQHGQQHLLPRARRRGSRRLHQGVHACQRSARTGYLSRLEARSGRGLEHAWYLQVSFYHLGGL